MKIDCITVGGTEKVQEWFIPWTEWGVGGFPEMPAAGTMFAINLGYNDRDADDAESYNSLGWPNTSDPWQAPCETAGEVTGVCDNYGDIEIMADFLDENASAAAPVRQAPARTASPAASKAGLYSLTGKRLGQHDAARSLVIRQDNVRMAVPCIISGR